MLLSSLNGGLLEFSKKIMSNIVTFGKFKNRPISELDDGYLRWGSENLKGEWKDKFQEELNRRNVSNLFGIKAKSLEDADKVRLGNTTFVVPKIGKVGGAKRVAEKITEIREEVKSEVRDIANNWNSLVPKDKLLRKEKSVTLDQDSNVNGYDPLIFGKDETENVVSIEVDNEGLLLFIEKDGIVTQERREYKPWILLNRSVDSPKCTRLNGDQFYKYKLTLDSVENWKEAKQKLYKRNAEFYCINDLKSQAMVSEGITYYKGMQIKDVSVLSFDIEGSGLVYDDTSCVYLITNTFRKGDKKIEKMFNLEDYDSSSDMIQDWCKWVQDVNPSILLAHNGFSYDMPYMHHVGGELPLGRSGEYVEFNERTRKFRKDGSQFYDYHEAKIFGRELIDSLWLSYKYDIGRKYDSYGLKNIIKQEGMEKEGRSFIDASKMRQYWEERKTKPEMWEKVKQYAMEDSEDALKLFDLMGPSFFYMSNSIPKSFQEVNNSATGAQINSMMVRSYLQNGKSVAKADEVTEFQGAFSRGAPGVYKHCIRWDISAMYPSIMRQYKIHHPKKDPEMNFYKMVEFFTQERLKNKKLAKDSGSKYYQDLEQSSKILINSKYGFMSSQGLNYNFPDGAALVTKTGRDILEKSVIWASSKTINELFEDKNVTITDSDEE